MEGVKEGVSAFLTGAGKVWDALTPAFTLGADEITRAMFHGNAYVFHGDTIPQEQQQAKPIEAQKEAELEREM